MANTEYFNFQNSHHQNDEVIVAQLADSRKFRNNDFAENGKIDLNRVDSSSTFYYHHPYGSGINGGSEMLHNSTPQTGHVNNYIDQRVIHPAYHNELSSVYGGLSTSNSEHGNNFSDVSSGRRGQNTVLTPPGSPRASCGDQYNQIAKPVAQKRLSEKQISRARVSIAEATTTNYGSGDDSSENSGYATLGRSLSTEKRTRCVKKPIPDDEKDGRYYERRMRNNVAAKKSRDHRKAREDEIAIRASFLEKENAILRAQLATLREEANSLRHMLLQKRAS